MQNITLTGRVGKSELKYTGQGTAVLEFSVAVTESFRKNNEWIKIVEWFECKLWGKAAEQKGDFINKGVPVMVCGRQRTETWENSNSEKRSKKTLLVDKLEFFAMDRPKNTPANQGQAGQQNNNPAPSDNFTCDDIPF